MGLVGTLEVIEGCKPAEVAGIAIARVAHGFHSVVLDLAKLQLTPDAAVDWLTEYCTTVKSVAPSFNVKPPFPTVAIIAHGIDRETTTQLRLQGAVVIDNALPSNEHITSAEALDETLVKMSRRSASTGISSNRSGFSQINAPRELSTDDLSALNSYPAGVTREQLAAMLDSLSYDNY